MNKKYPLVFSLLILAFALFIYIRTIPPTVWFIDSGELAAVCTTLGIAHPTGYPLFTIVGHLFTNIPIGSEAYRMNLMCGIFCALGVFMLFYLMKYIFSLYTAIPSKNITAVKKGGSKNVPKENKLPESITISLSIFTSLILAFSVTYWFIVRLGKVYPIQVFLEISILLVFLKAIFYVPEKRPGNNFFRNNKYYFVFAFLLGLAFTNHMTSVLLIPACFTLIFTENYKDLKKTIKLLAMMGVFFIAAFSLYLYLPIRAAQNPTFIWGNPVTLERLMWHISGKQFSVWIFSAEGSVTTFVILLLILLTVSVIGLIKHKTLNPYYHFAFFIGLAVITFLFLNGSSEIVAKQFKHFYGSLWAQYGAGVILLAIPGIYRLSRYNIKIYYLTLLTFFTCVFYSVNYDIFDIDSYFLLAYITIAIWIAFGAMYFYELIAATVQNKNYRAVFIIALIIVGLLGLKMNYAESDESKDYSVEEYTMNIFMNAAPNSIIISSQWDFWLSASWYYHFVKHIRPDIVAIDKELLRRSWYFKFLEQNYPEVYNNSKPEIDKFLPELYKFEHNIPYDQSYIMKTFEDMLTSFVTKNPDRKIYDTWEIEQNKNEYFARDYSRIPDGLLFRLVKFKDPNDKKLDDYQIYNFNFTPATSHDYYHDLLMNSYSIMLTLSAEYLASHNRIDDAKKYLNLALTANPVNSRAVELKRKLQLTQ